MKFAEPLSICPCCRRPGISRKDRRACAASGGGCICRLCNGRSREVWRARLLASVLLYGGGMLLLGLLVAACDWANLGGLTLLLAFPFLLFLQPLLSFVEGITLDLVPLVPDRA